MIDISDMNNRSAPIRSFLSNLALIAILLLEAGIPTVARATPLNCHDGMKALLDSPSEQSYWAVTGSRDLECWAVIGSSNTKLNRLIDFVRQGHQWATRYLAEHLKRLDGGNLEDALIAIGEFGDHNMPFLLLLAKEAHLSEHELQDALTMLPTSLSDNPGAQLDALRARRSKVANVRQANLKTQRLIALKAIDQFIAEVKTHAPPVSPEIPEQGK